MRQLLRAAICLFCLGPVDQALAAEAPAALAAATAVVRGSVVDATGAAVPGAQIAVTPVRPGAPFATMSDARGRFELLVIPGDYTIQVAFPGFAELSRRVTARTGQPLTLELGLEVAGFQESVTVGARAGYQAPALSSATKTATALLDVPQAVSVVSRTLIADQRMTSMGDVTRYMPGVGYAQGEGNRDTPILRGNSSTSDFFVDGVRDDVQYFRDVYNVERVEALKGPNAMIFGRGGVGGVINRVTRQADWGQSQEATFQAGSWGNRRMTADVGQGLTDTVAVRLTGLYENSDSYRDGVGVERYGVNPTVAFRSGPNTTIRASYEYFRDERIADRGVPSLGNRPVATDPGTFFGDPRQSPTHATVNLTSANIEHRFGPRATLRNRVSFGHYDKFYQNVFPGAANQADSTVAITAYNNATTRRNLFNQTDLIASIETGPIGHTVLAGAELGRQVTANFRQTGYFTDLGANATTFTTALASPTIAPGITFRQSATDADNDATTTILGAYIQDQIAFSRRVEAVAGLRVDSFRASVSNNRTATDFASRDNLLSPRLGLIFKPAPTVALYGSYSLTYLPRAGEQLSSLSVTNQALEPETFRNYEVGAKWDTASGLSLTAAVYQLDRGNVAIPSPDDPAVSLLVDAQRTRGLELGLNGNVTSEWTVAGGYAYQDGQITQSISGSAQAGAVLAQLPKHSISLWNRYQITSRFAAGLGVIARGDVFTSTDNRVSLPGWARLDSAIYYDLTSALRIQANIENLTGARYFLNAHNNNNITPGSPRGLRVSLATRF